MARVRSWPPALTAYDRLALPRFGRAHLGPSVLSPAALTDLLARGPFPAVHSIWP